MSSDKPGLLLVLSAPSGAGKTTLARLFVARNPDAHFSVSATTRAPRGAERDGVDYHFLSPARFAELAGAGAFAEWAEVHRNRYGTLRSTVDDALARGQIALFDIDVQGGAAIEAKWPRETVSVFVLPPSMGELARRLRARSTDSEEQIQHRLAVARAEIEHGGSCYDFLLVNDELEHALMRLQAIVASARARLAGVPAPDEDAIVAPLRRSEIDLAPWLAGAT